MMSAPSDPRERKWPMSLGGSWAEVQGVKIWDKERITSNHEATRPLPCGATRSQREISECRMGSVVHGRLRGRLCPPSPKPQALHHRTVSRLQATFLSNLKGNLLPSREGGRLGIPQPPHFPVAILLTHLLHFFFFHSSHTIYFSQL